MTKFGSHNTFGECLDEDRFVCSHKLLSWLCVYLLILGLSFVCVYGM